MFSIKNFPATRLVLKAVLSMVAIALLSLPATAQIGDIGNDSPLFTVTNLTSDIPNVGNNNDTDLVNPWGLVASPSSPWWVSDNATGLSTLYDGAGVKQGLVVTIPAWNAPTGGAPDGIVFNSTSDFKINGNSTHFLFATEDGTLQGWSGGTSAVIAVNNWPVAVYKGLALASAGGANYLYVANFRGGTVDVFDANFAPHSFGPNAFVDPTVPSAYSPFNVANINGNIVVTYALPDDQRHDDVAGAGHGYVRMFDSQGSLLMDFRHVFELNSPWAVALAPSSGFGSLSGKLLIGQFGSGAIVAYDPKNGRFLGPLLDTSALPIRINGLWGLGVGNGAKSGPTDTLYFTAGYFDEAHGLFGTISLAKSGKGK